MFLISLDYKFCFNFIELTVFIEFIDINLYIIKNLLITHTGDILLNFNQNTYIFVSTKIKIFNSFQFIFQRVVIKIIIVFKYSREIPAR